MGGLAAALVLVAAVVLLRLLGGHAAPWVVTTPNDSADVNGAPDFQTIMSAGDGTLLEDVDNAYWCTTSSCAPYAPLAPWKESQFGWPTGGMLPDGRPVLAALTETGGETLRLSLLHCTPQACAEVGGGTFTAPGFGSVASGPVGVSAVSADSAGFAVAFWGLDANGVESLYVAVCDSAACHRPYATSLGQVSRTGISVTAVAAAPHGGFAAAVLGDQGQVSVYRCASAPCRTAARQQVPGPSGGDIAITMTPSGQTLLAYANIDFSGNGVSSQVVLGSVGPSGSFSQLAAVNAPVAYVHDYAETPDPAIEFSGRDLLVVSENPSGHAVTLTTCAVTSCGNTTKVSQVATVGNPIVELGIGVPTGTPRIFWATQDTDILGAISYSGHLWIGNST